MLKIENKIKNSLGRAGVLTTAHGSIQTPAFVAVGTKATVKSLSPEQVKAAGSQVVLANTYHLYLEPGEKIVKEAGGLHKFMNWQGPTMTDSGGFQAFSLGVAYGSNLNKFIVSDAPTVAEIDEAYDKNKIKKAKITENGVEFQSIIDGSAHFFTPEKSIQIQNDLGADIIFAFDECTSPHASKEYLKEAMERTHRWAKRCLDFHNKKEQFLFGIVQGGRYEDLRKESAKTISGMDFGGFGVGGSFIKEDMATAVKWVNEILPEEKPRHLLGVGEPVDLILGVENGCDTFDCVSPTRLGRNGTFFTHQGKIHIENTKYRNIFEPIEKDLPDGKAGCGCYTCQNYTAAYVSHLFRSKEMLAGTLASIHNLYFLNNLMSRIRQSILDGTFFELKEEFLRNYKS
ncbi:MAG: tRNA guanosine(34) transglycosylase Tgt [Candidatus Paceibacterota bacterium]|jgi:queuine tRNA-ribosyltransferase